MTTDADGKVLAGRTGAGVVAPDFMVHGMRAYDLGVGTVVTIAIDEVVEVPGVGGGYLAAGGVWLEWMADVPWYVLVGRTGSTPDPLPAARTVPASSPTQVCKLVPANQPWMRWFDPLRSELKALAQGPAGVLRVERVSVLFGHSNQGA